MPTECRGVIDYRLAVNVRDVGNMVIFDAWFVPETVGLCVLCGRCSPKQGYIVVGSYTPQTGLDLLGVNISLNVVDLLR